MVRKLQLIKVLYGFKYILRVWFDKINNFLIECGFVFNVSDFNLYIYKKGSELVIIAFYVDDFFAVIFTKQLLEGLKDKMKSIK